MPSSRFPALVAILAIFGFAVPSFSQAPYVVADLNTTHGATSSSFPSDFVQVGDSVFMWATTSATGMELWKITGSSAELVKDIRPGTGSAGSVGGGLGTFQNLLLFRANDGVTGQELWRSDGTGGGTTLVKDIRPAGGSSPTRATEFGDLAFFTADDGVHGREPWVTDGTEAGTRLLLDLLPGLTSSSPSFAVLDGLYMFAPDGLWTTDGTTSGTIRIKSFSSPRGLAVAGSLMFFAATSPTAGYELWRSDGTEAGTYMVADLRPGTADMFDRAGAFAHVAQGNVVHFVADDGVLGRGIWRSDGTAGGTTFIHALPASDTFAAQTLVSANGLTFWIQSDGVWRTDGTSAGTMRVASLTGAHSMMEAFSRLVFGRMKDLWSSDGTAAGTARLDGIQLPTSSIGLTWLAGKLFFVGEDTLHGAEPWRCTALVSAQCGIAANIRPDGLPSSFPEKLTAADGLVYFTASVPPYSVELWRSDGTGPGTLRLTDFADGTFSTLFGDFETSGRDLYFVESHTGLWKTDGSAGGTHLFLEGLPAAFQPSTPLFASRGLSYASVEAPSDRRLWRTDGTASGTISLDLTGQSASSLASPINPSGFLEAGGQVWLKATRSDSAIWSTDGSVAGTRLRFPLPSASGPLFEAGGNFFFARNATEIWTSDGSVDGTRLLKTITPAGGGASNPEQMTQAGSLLFFVANGAEHGKEVWRSDGTEAGTYVVKDIAAGPGGAEPQALAASGRVLYFIADDGVHGAELWRSDGTDAGTVRLSDLGPGGSLPSPPQLAAADGLAWFAASDGVHGTELWRSDGTPIGTGMVADLNPGSASSSPAQLTPSGRLLYFTAENALGRELWAVPLGAASAISIEDVRVNESEATARFELRRTGDTSGAASVHFQTRDGSAGAPADYQARAETVSFAPGQAIRYVDVTLINDVSLETNETLSIGLSSPAGAALSREVGTAVIEDDDHRVELTVDIVQESDHFKQSRRSISIRNQGPSTATDVRLRLSTSPYGWTFDSGSLQCQRNLNPTECRVAPVGPGQEVIVQIEVTRSGRVDPNKPPGVTITADVRAAEPELNMSNNLFSVMASSNDQLFVRPFLEVGLPSPVIYMAPQAHPTASRNFVLTSSNPQVAVSPQFGHIPAGERKTTFTLGAPQEPGETLLKITAEPSVNMRVPFVQPGTMPKLDVALLPVDTVRVTYGQTAQLRVQVAARRHDGTLPTGIVHLLDASGSPLAQLALDAGASATFARAGLEPGVYRYRVRYAGDAHFNPLELSDFVVDVSKWKTSMTLTGPLMTCGTGGVQATIRTSDTSLPPIGDVEFRVGTTVVGRVTLEPTGKPGEAISRFSHNFETSNATVFVSAFYPGGGKFLGSSDGGLHLLAASCLPLNVTATGISSNSIHVSWSAVGAQHYQILRAQNRSTGWSGGLATTATAAIDTPVGSDSVYLYTVRAVDAAGNVLGYGSPDLATTIRFQDDPVIPRQTLFKAVHVEQLREAILRVNTLSGDFTFHGPVAVAGAPVRAADILHLRNELARGRQALGLQPIAVTDVLNSGLTMKAVHIQELREGVK
jgi:ELWxxDGT repeat protein